jgi:hypothetical protein
MAADQTILFLMAVVVAFLIGLSKGGLGGMLGALAVPMDNGAQLLVYTVI